MTVLRVLRDRFSTTESSAGQAGDAPGDPAAEAGLPFAGYDRLDARQVIDGLHDRSQIELEAVESYERSHQDRESVPDYDALSSDEVVTALEEADLATIKKVRGYERKFANRPGVLEEVVRVHHRRLANRHASAPPAYQSMSATSGPIRDGEPTE
jgi:hypothetical protein